MIRSPASKRYNIRIVGLSLAYALLLTGAVYLFKHRLVPQWANYPVAILPALPIIGIFLAMGRYLVEEQDEFVRMLMVRQALWASAFALSLATTWGFLENFDLVAHVDAYYIVAAWFFGLGLGGIYNRLTLGDSGGC